MISDVRSRRASREEIKGILSIGRDGVPIGRLVALNSDEDRKDQRLHTAIVAKVKTGTGFKCRLCIRGGMQSHALTAFTSAPTASRECLRVAAFLMSNEESSQMKMVDISQAFTQSDLYHASDRVVGISPTSILAASPNWEGALISDRQLHHVEGDNEKATIYNSPQKSTFGVLLYRPLRGTRDAPGDGTVVYRQYYLEPSSSR